jgi:diguanylate cyclase (GGDEF)-like protein
VCSSDLLADSYVNPADREIFLEALRLGGGHVTGYETHLRHSDGHDIWVMTNAHYVRDEAGNVVGIEGTTRDISDHKLAQERIDFLAHHDPLTELPNRLLFKDRFEQATMHGDRAGRYTALLFIDLDRFKPINDQYGHQVGDLVLREVAKRLRTCIRGTDTVSRQGGDEFLMALTDLRNGEAAAPIAQKALAALTQPFHVAGQEMTLGASIGIALSPDEGDTFENLLHRADEAMYRAKNAGGNAFRFYTEKA